MRRARRLQHAGLTAEDVDIVIVATTTPDDTFPSTATKVQAALGMRRGAAFDIQAVCSGFIYGLTLADNFIRCGQAKTILVIGAETMSRIVDWTDRGTCVLFGRRRRRCGAEAETGTGTIATAAFSTPRSIPTAARAICSMSMAAVILRHRRENAHGGPRSVQACVTNIAAAVEATMKATG